jgi:hypothetical protein
MARFVEVSVPDFRKIFEGEKDVVFYSIALKSAQREWSVSKRYSELEKFNQELLINHGLMPSFPTKSILPFRKADEIETRRAQLEQYLKVT